MGGKMVRRTLLVSALVCSLQVSKPAYSGAAIGATEPTQWLNQLQLILSYIEQVTTAAVQVENIARGALQPVYDMKARVDGVRDVVSEGLSLAYTIQNIDQVFTDRYKDFDDFIAGDYDRTAFTEDLRNWTKTTEDSIMGALEGAGIQMESLQEEDLIIKQLHSKIDGGGRGQQRALDASNEIAMLASQQMQSLRQLVATDMQVKAAYFQQETTIRKATEAGSSEFYNPQPAGGAPVSEPIVVNDGQMYETGPGAYSGAGTRRW